MEGQAVVFLVLELFLITASPEVSGLLHESLNGYGNGRAGSRVFSVGAIFSSKCSIAIDDISLNSCRNSWARGG
jgi:hypothetical protein